MMTELERRWTYGDDGAEFVGVHSGGKDLGGRRHLDGAHRVTVHLYSQVRKKMDVRHQFQFQFD